MTVRLIVVPYDSGNRARRMGRGPLVLADDRGFREAVGEHRQVTIETRGDFADAIPSAFELARSIAQEVRAARDAREFPIVLSGNCNSSIGTVPGIGAHDAGIVWLDAHCDFNTPETTRSGFFDGMALATITGRCWSQLAATVPHFSPVPDEHVVLAGFREADREEQQLLNSSRIELLSAESLLRPNTPAVDRALSNLASRVRRVYLHVDLDVHDAAEFRVNAFDSGSGLPHRVVRDFVRTVAERFPIDALSFTAYDPNVDPEHRVPDAAANIVRAVTAVQTRLRHRPKSSGSDGKNSAD